MPRRLPVIQSGSPDEPESRAPAQWVAIAAALAIALWVPLVLAALALGRALAARIAGVAEVSTLDATALGAGKRAAVAAALVVPVLASLALAFASAGAIVGRFGGRAGPREAVLGATLAALVAWAITVSGGALRPWPVAIVTLVVMGALAAVAAGLGARAGFGRRPRI